MWRLAAVVAWATLLAAPVAAQTSPYTAYVTLAPVVQPGNPSTAYSSTYNYVRVRYGVSYALRWCGLIKFAAGTEDSLYAVIDSVEVHMYATGNGSTYQSPDMIFYPVTAAWTDTVTWYGIENNYGAAVDTVLYADFDSLFVNTQEVHFNVDPALVQAWVDGTQHPEFGFLIQGTDPIDSGYYNFGDETRTLNQRTWFKIWSSPIPATGATGLGRGAGGIEGAGTTRLGNPVGGIKP